MWAHGSGFPDEFDGRILNIEQLRHETGCTQRDAVAALNQCGDDVEMAKAGLQAVRASGERKRDAARRRTLDPEAAVEFEPVSTHNSAIGHASASASASLPASAILPASSALAAAPPAQASILSTSSSLCSGMK